jgi:toxin YoeB
MGRYFVVLTDTTKQQLVKLHKSGDKILLRRIERILTELSEHPFDGIENRNNLNMNFPDCGQEE